MYEAWRMESVQRADLIQQRVFLLKARGRRLIISPYDIFMNACETEMLLSEHLNVGV